MFYLLSKILNKLIKIIYTLSGDKLPQMVSVIAIIQNEKEEFLIQDRADRKGFCLPGGLTKAGETLEDAVIREIFEETGIKASFPTFLFYKNADNMYKYSLVMVYKCKEIGGNLKDSWEGKALWKKYDEFRNHMAFDQNKIIDKYLEEINS